MRYLLSAVGIAALRRFARPKTLLALDYDGTLASIADLPSQAHMRASTRRLLTSIVRQYPSIVITGRARQDAQRFLAGISPIEIVGNHGLEDSDGGPQLFVRRVAGWRHHLTRRLGSVPGLVIEDKRYSLSVHYRGCRKPGTARKAVMDAVRELKGARIIGGKAVINLVPEEASHKGAALRSALKRSGCSRAIYVGDDDTDEDVFAIARPNMIFSVRVGRNHDSCAQFYLRGQSEMDYLLKVLLALH